MKSFKTLALAASFGLIFAGTGWANPTHDAQPAAAWKPATLRMALQAMPEGNVERGKSLNSERMCASCHGEDGIAPTQNWPHTAGQKADYTYKILLDYRSGLRHEDNRSILMRASVEGMSAQEMADLAAYYASLPKAHGTESASANTAITPQIEKLVRKGDPSRLMTPCASCHGVKGQGGKNAAPALAGQNATAFIRTMALYKSGARHNDVNQSMSQFARKLSTDEIRQLAHYYESLHAE